MKLSIKVKTEAKREKVESLADGGYTVSVKERAVEGKANEAVCRAVARHFGVSAGRVIIKSGKMSKNKIIEIK